MKTKLFFFSLLLSFSFTLAAQIYTGDLGFASQQEIDDFLVNNPSITQIDGNVTLGTGGVEITNLDGLQNITSVFGNLIIEAAGPQPMSLAGLSSLTEVGGELRITDNSTFLVDLTGLENLDYVNEIDLSLSASTDITALYGVSNVSSIYLREKEQNNYTYSNLFPSVLSLDVFHLYPAEESTIAFDGFDGLSYIGTANFQDYIDSIGVVFSSFDAFHNVSSISNFKIEWGHATAPMTGFENLQSATTLWLEVNSEYNYPDFESLQTANDIMLMNPSLIPIPAPSFSSLENVNGNLVLDGGFSSLVIPTLITMESLFIVGNNDYSTLETLELVSLETIEEGLVIANTLLENLDGFPSLQYVGGQVTIMGNPVLTDCSIAPLCEALFNAPANFSIFYNSTGCDNIEELYEGCNGNSYVSGSIYADLDCDGSFNNQDVILDNILVLNQENVPAGTLYGGNYFMPAPNYTTTVIHAEAMPGFLTPNPYTFEIVDEDSAYTEIDFRFCPAGEYHNLSITSWGDGHIPGFNATHTVMVKNYGPQAEQAVVTFDFTGMSGVTVVDTDGGVVNGTMITWEIPAITFMQSYTFLPVLNIDAGVPLGTTHTSVSTVAIAGGPIDEVATDDMHTWNGIVNGSFDPNDKSVNIQAMDIETVDMDGIYLDYTIRFQNTGTGPAQFIRVEDVIDEDLDLSSIEVLATSHDYELTFLEDRKVEWFFDNIQLPDSTSDEPGSHGFIHFRIRSKEYIQLSDVISNSAAIFFDYNEPVITNTAQTVFYTCDGDIEIIDNSICETENIELYVGGAWNNVEWYLDGEIIGSGVPFILENPAAGEYEFAVIASGDYCSYNENAMVEVWEMPGMIVLTQDGNTLTATDYLGTYYWSVDGETIDVTESNSIEMTQSGDYSVWIRHHACLTNTVTQYFEYVSVEENNMEVSVTFMPNPATESTTLQMTGNVPQGGTLRITDTTGRIVHAENITSSTIRLNTLLLPKGMYHVNVINNEGGVAGVGKLVVQ